MNTHSRTCSYMSGVSVFYAIEEMSRMNCKALFFDVDGTLVSFKTHRIPQSALDAIRAARQKGIKVFLATGRPFMLLDNIAGLEYDGMVTTTGAHCLDGAGHTLSTHGIEADSVARLVHYCEQNPESAFPVIFVTEKELFVTKVTSDVEEVSEMLDFEIPPIRPASYANDKEILQVIAFFPESEEKYCMEQLLPDCAAMRWHPGFVDIVTKRVCKSSGVDFMLSRHGILLEESVAFGDGGNDIDMLRHARVGVAMGNASQVVKDAADYVTETVDCDGVYEALKKLDII